MKNQIFLALLSFIHFPAQSQDVQTTIDTVKAPIPALFDNSPVGLGVLVADNQKGSGNYYDILTAKPTIKKTIENKDGVFYVQAYINRDIFNIIATRINKNNYQYYKAYQQSYYSGDIPAIDTIRAYECKFIIEDSWNPTFIEGINMNDRKFDGFKYLYFVKDVRTGEVVSKLALDFVFPKPVPLFLTSEPYIINAFEARQGQPLSASPEQIEYYRKKEKAGKLANTFFATQSNLPDHLILPSAQNSLLLQFKSLGYGVNNYLEYKLDEDSTFRTTPKNFNPFIILKDLEPGRHSLQVRYNGQSDQVFEYQFEVEPRLIQTTGFKIFLGSIFSICLISFVFRLIIQRQKRQLKEENAQRAQAQTQIASLRAQLNPHFVFNALNSIQGLVNKNDKEGANLYISKFGSLMRDILDKNDRVSHALAQEIKQLESYLQLEQLRFQFNYQITLDETINPAEQDFPVMLLQPFAENAIKHGISWKKESGNITISFKRNKSDLQVAITDNGNGYDVNEPSAGYGIKLIQDRISNLNQLFPEQPILCEFISTPGQGTTVTLSLTRWL